MPSGNGKAVGRDPDGLSESATDDSALTDILLGIRALEVVAATLTLMALELLVDPQAGALEPAGFEVEHHLAFRLELQQGHLVRQGARQSLEGRPEGHDPLPASGRLAHVPLRRLVLLASALGRLQRDLIRTLPRLAHPS